MEESSNLMAFYLKIHKKKFFLKLKVRKQNQTVQKNGNYFFCQELVGFCI